LLGGGRVRGESDRESNGEGKGESHVATFERDNVDSVKGHLLGNRTYVR